MGNNRFASLEILGSISVGKGADKGKSISKENNRFARARARVTLAQKLEGPFF